jgi:hypothetical protein
MIEIPLIKSVPEFSENVAILGKYYTFKFKWNTRGEYWTFDLFEQDVAIVTGIKFVLGGNMTQHLRSVEIPALGFITFDAAGTGEKPGFHDLNDRIFLELLTDADAVYMRAAP